MSPFSEMRDPRESQLLPIEGVAGYISDDWTLEDEVTSFSELDWKAKQLKDLVKVLALTKDEDREDDAAAVFGRGFAHPRLWEHYADNHRGVCLCLDRDVLIQGADHALRRRGKLVSGGVTYVDAEIAPQARYVILDALRHRTAQQVLDDHVRTHMQEIFFTKLTDWATEVEFRLVLPAEDEEPAYVGIQDALRAVVIGERVSDYYLPALAKLCEDPFVPIYKIRWPYGRPHLEPKRVARESD